MCVHVPMCIHGGREADGNRALGITLEEMLREPPCHVDVMRLGLAFLEQCLSSWYLGYKHMSQLDRARKAQRCHSLSLWDKYLISHLPFFSYTILVNPGSYVPREEVSLCSRPCRQRSEMQAKVFGWGFQEF